MLDKDGNGSVSTDELRHVLRNAGEDVSEDEIEQIIASADIDNDGQIKYDG